jgi:hypothetical protein
MKTIKQILIVISAGLLLVGCATSDKNSGGMGNDSQYSTGSSQNTPAANAQPMNGADGSVSRSNPFGLGSGSGLTSAH